MSDNEDDLFRQAMQKVKRLTSKARQVKPPKSPGKRPHTRQKAPPVAIDLEWIAPENWVSGPDSMEFSRGGLQHRLLQRLQRGQITVQARLDLHRLTVAEALDQTATFINTCCSKSIRCVCIVHGKGHYSPTGKPLIKNALNRWLREQPLVLAFCSAQPRHGGTGAVYVLLKSKPTGTAAL